MLVSFLLLRIWNENSLPYLFSKQRLMYSCIGGSSVSVSLSLSAFWPLLILLHALITFFSVVHCMNDLLFSNCIVSFNEQLAFYKCFWFFDEAVNWDASTCLDKLLFVWSQRCLKYLLRCFVGITAKLWKYSVVATILVTASAIWCHNSVGRSGFICKKKKV